MPDILSILWVLWTLTGAAYGMVLNLRHEAQHPDQTLTVPQRVLWLVMMCYLWPVMLAARGIKFAKERRALKAKMMREAAIEHASEVKRLRVKQLSDEAEEEWKEINAEAQKKLDAKRKRYADEHWQWDAEQKQLSEQAYRKLNYSGIREARLRARSEGNDSEANMLNRILEDKILETADNVDFLNALSPDERQKVVARAQQIHRDRYGTRFHHSWTRNNPY